MWAEYYKDQGDVKRLDKLADEEQNVDLGMGLDEKNGSLVKGSAFDRSLPGIKMLGYGVDENGDPNNVALVMKRLGEIWESCDFESGDYPSEELKAEATRLFDKLNLCHDDCISQYAEITTKSKYLEENQDRMGLQGAYLNACPGPRSAPRRPAYPAASHRPGPCSTPPTSGYRRCPGPSRYSRPPARRTHWAFPRPSSGRWG